MRAGVLHEFRRPWRVEDVPEPEAGPGQVVIAVRASGVCGTDVHVHHGYLDVTPPLIPGHEAVGVVEAVGPDVAWPRIGDRVGVSWVQRSCGACRRCSTGQAAHCRDAQTWMDLGGGHAERMVAWAEGCTAIPDCVSFEEAAPLFCAGHTVMAGLRAAALRPGDRVAVLGLGGLGHLAIQCAKALGHEVLALTSTDEKALDAKDLGADDAIATGPHVGADLDDAGRADVVICTSNSAMQVSQVVNGIEPGGRLVSLGMVDGPVILDLNDVTFQGVQIVGVVPVDRSHLRDVLDLAAQGRVRSVIETYRLDAVNDVITRLERGAIRYRAVLTHDA